MIKRLLFTKEKKTIVVIITKRHQRCTIFEFEFDSNWSDQGGQIRLFALNYICKATNLVFVHETPYRILLPGQLFLNAIYYTICCKLWWNDKIKKFNDLMKFSKKWNRKLLSPKPQSDDNIYHYIFRMVHDRLKKFTANQLNRNRSQVA